MVGFLYVLGVTLVDPLEFGFTSLCFQEFRGYEFKGMILYVSTREL